EPDDWHLFEPTWDDGFFAPKEPVRSALTEQTRPAAGANVNTKAVPESTPVEVKPAPAEEKSRIQPAGSVSYPASTSPTGQTPKVAMPFFVAQPAVHSAQNARSTGADGYDGGEAHKEDPKMLRIILRSCGDKSRDVRRMKRIHGILKSYP